MKPVLAAGFLALLCASCDLQGLDLQTPSDARKYVQACARGADAIHCRAMQRLLTTITGDVTVLLPGTADRDIRASLDAYVRSTGRSILAFEQSAVGEAYAKANIVLAARLQTGTMTTLDGKTHTVSCQQDAYGLEACTVDGKLRGVNRLAPFQDAVGSVYSMDDPAAQTAASAYLPF